MEAKKCKYCGAKPESYGVYEFDDDVCPCCAKGREAISEIVPRKSASADLAKISLFAKEGDYLEVTEWANQEGIDVELSIGNSDKPTQRFSLTYDEYEAMVNIVALISGEKPVFYLKQ